MNFMRRNNSFQFEKHLFAKNAQGIAYVIHGALLFLALSQRKPQVRSKNMKDDLYYHIKKICDLR